MRVVVGNLLLLSNKFSSYLKIHSVSGFNICLATSPAGEAQHMEVIWKSQNMQLAFLSVKS